MKTNVLLIGIMLFMVTTSIAQDSDIHWPQDGDQVVKTQYEFVEVETDSAVWDFSHAIETGAEHIMQWHNMGDSVLVRVSNDYGFMDADGGFHYHIKDWQAGGRAVIDEAGTLEEVNSYYPYGELYSGHNAFAFDLTNSLQSLQNGWFGNIFIADLISSNNVVTIKYGKNNSTSVDDDNIFWNPDNTAGGITLILKKYGEIAPSTNRQFLQGHLLITAHYIKSP